jgi:hypothetical protein
MSSAIATKESINGSTHEQDQEVVLDRLPVVRKTSVGLRKRGDCYEVTIVGDGSEEVLTSIVMAVLGCGDVWACDGTISLGSVHSPRS